jgi:hypothetical protein
MNVSVTYSGSLSIVKVISPDQVTAASVGTNMTKTSDGQLPRQILTRVITGMTWPTTIASDRCNYPASSSHRLVVFSRPVTRSAAVADFQDR